MANHKRRRPKSRRAGCLWCKPHKHQRVKQRDKTADRLAANLEVQEYQEMLHWPPDERWWRRSP